jgi:hypothetical protein
VGRRPDSDLSEEALHAATTTALGDERLVGLLADHPHRIEQVEQLRGAPSGAGAGRHVVTVCVRVRANPLRCPTTSSSQEPPST